MRDHRIDNIRFLLIVLVVFGHLIESLPFGSAHFAYTVIYTFHMPAFAFVTGYFAKLKKRTMVSYALDYCVFQVLYLLMDAMIWPAAIEPFPWVLITPEWLTWYLLASMAWLCLVPLLRTQSRARMVATLAVSVVIALAVGFAPCIGRVLSLSRILVFCPFFIAGHYARQLRLAASEGVRSDGCGEAHGGGRMRPVLRIVLVIAGLAGVAGSIALAASGDVSYAMLYADRCYAGAGGDALQRLALMAVAAGWICLLFALVPNRRIRLISNAGSHTMPVFLLHGFIARLLMVTDALAFNAAGGIACAAILAIGLVIALGNRPLDRIVRFGL